MIPNTAANLELIGSKIKGSRFCNSPVKVQLSLSGMAGTRAVHKWMSANLRELKWCCKEKLSWICPHWCKELTKSHKKTENCFFKLLLLKLVLQALMQDSESYANSLFQMHGYLHWNIYGICWQGTRLFIPETFCSASSLCFSVLALSKLWMHAGKHNMDLIYWNTILKKTAIFLQFSFLVFFIFLA